MLKQPHKLTIDCPLATAMTTWRPTNNFFNDFIDFEYGGTTYLIGVGCYDATIYMVKLDSNGDSAGYAYSRAIMDYSLAPSSGVRTMDCFGAGCACRTNLTNRVLLHTAFKRLLALWQVSVRYEDLLL